jgi:hypothetical protein
MVGDIAGEQKRKMKKFEVLTLLREYKKWVENGDVEFLKGRNEKEDVVMSLEKLIDAFSRAKRKAGSRGNISEHLKWHEVHEEGRQLWRKLASYALNNLDPNSKGNSELFKFLDAATKFEDLLYGLEKYYRDHTLHSLWVYLIGEYLLRKRKHLYSIRNRLNWYLFDDIDRDKNTYDYDKELVSEATRQEEKFCAEVNEKRDAIWCIIALCHDLGYSLAKLRNLNEKVQDVLKYFDVTDFRHVGYSLDIEHQYLVAQFLELMAMDVRIVPSEEHSKIKQLKKEKDKSKKELEKELKDKLNKRNCKKREYIELKDKYRVKMELVEKEYRKKLEEKVLVKCYRDDSTYWRLCSALEKKEHGILSAYLIFKLLGIFADTSVRGPAEEWGLDDNEVQYNIIRGDILFAIAQHEFDFAHLKRISSLAEILVLADELEEFSRLGRQLLSRKYFDTAAEAAIRFETVDGGILKQNSRVNIEILYEAKHEEEDEFLGFFRRKAEQLCRMYSLEPIREEECDEEEEYLSKKYGTIESIKMIVKWKKAGTKKYKTYNFILSGNLTEIKGRIPSFKYKNKTYRTTSYPLKCYDDEIRVLIKNKKGRVIREIPLKEWLGLKEEE